jgi:hypothetical protein
MQREVFVRRACSARWSQKGSTPLGRKGLGTPQEGILYRTPEDPWVQAAPRSVFQCEGWQHCSQMSSCEKARFIVWYRPDTKMDGDGVPGEQHLCGGLSQLRVNHLRCFSTRQLTSLCREIGI